MKYKHKIRVDLSAEAMISFDTELVYSFPATVETLVKKSKIENPEAYNKAKGDIFSLFTGKSVSDFEREFQLDLESLKGMMLQGWKKLQDTAKDQNWDGGDARWEKYTKEFIAAYKNKAQSLFKDKLDKTTKDILSTAKKNADKEMKKVAAKHTRQKVGVAARTAGAVGVGVGGVIGGAASGVTGVGVPLAIVSGAGIFVAFASAYKTMKSLNGKDALAIDTQMDVIKKELEKAEKVLLARKEKLLELKASEKYKGADAKKIKEKMSGSKRNDNTKFEWHRLEQSGKLINEALIQKHARVRNLKMEIQNAAGEKLFKYETTEKQFEDYKNETEKEIAGFIDMVEKMEKTLAEWTGFAVRLQKVIAEKDDDDGILVLKGDINKKLNTAQKNWNSFTKGCDKIVDSLATSSRNLLSVYK